MKINPYNLTDDIDFIADEIYNEIKSDLLNSNPLLVEEEAFINKISDKLRTELKKLSPDELTALQA